MTVSPTPPQDLVHSGCASVPAVDCIPASNSRLIAELQAVTIAIHLVGLNRLPEVMRNGQAVRHD